MFIKLIAAFKSEGQPNFEELGIDVSKSDFDDCEWEPLYVNPEYIVSMNENNAGKTNITLVTGEIWSVQDSIEGIKNDIFVASKTQP